MTFLFLILSLLQVELPKYEQYPVKEIFNGVPVKVDLNSHKEGRLYRTRILEGVEKGVNFAGHYRIVLWGCGSNCQQFAIIDLQTGKICAMEGSGMGIVFRKDSRMIVVNPIDQETFNSITDKDKYLYPTEYYYWNGRKLQLIKKSVSVFPYSIEAQQ